MAKKEKKIVAKAELQDLSREMQELATGKEGCFYEYQPRNYAGSRIYAEILRNFADHQDRFIFSDDLPEEGLLSICQGLSAAISVFENLNVNNKGKGERLIEMAIDKLMSKVKLEDGGYRIDASPYLEKNDIFNDISYIDSITWIVSVVLGLVRLEIKGMYTIKERHKQDLIDLFNYCMKSINEAFISDSRSKRRFNCGWNFAAGCEEPSLYFTFAVSELLLDMLSTFENVIRVADVDLISAKIKETIDTDGLLESNRYKENADAITNALDLANENEEIEGVSGALDSFYQFNDKEKLIISEVYQKLQFIRSECGENLKRIENNGIEVQREQAYFKLLNNNCAPYDDGSPYMILEENCKKSANVIWNLTSENLASEFYSSNLETIVSPDAIRSSVSSDAVFNVIFAVNAIINSGLDEDYEDMINYFTVNGTDDYLQAITEYDNMRDTLRLAYENCYQFMMRLKKEKREYKISEFTLSFDESFTKHSRHVRDLRNAHIRVFSLMPLMVRTKTVIGEFLIKYPQYDMILFLEQILKYRCWDKENEKYLWLWENDGYSTSSNYYFITALSGFYDYYETYENVFRVNANNNKVAKQDIEKKYHKSLVESGKAVNKDLSEFEENEQRIKSLEEEVEALHKRIGEYENDPLRSALTGFVTGVIKDAVMDVISAQLSREANRIISETKSRVNERAESIKIENETDRVGVEDWASAGRSERSGIEKGVNDIMLAVMAEQLGEVIYSSRQTAEDRDKALDNIGRYVNRTDKDIKQALRYYLQGIADDKKSNFVANKGKTTLPGAEHIKLMDILEEKDD